jgi:hypothetical protein
MERAASVTGLRAAGMDRFSYVDRPPGGEFALENANNWNGGHF